MNCELTIKNTNKSNSKFEIRNCLFAVAFVLFILVGLFTPTAKARATTTTSQCWVYYDDNSGNFSGNGGGTSGGPYPGALSYSVHPPTDCDSYKTKPHVLGVILTTSTSSETVGTLGDTPFEKAVLEWGCDVVTGSGVKGCLLNIVFVLYYAVPAFFLWLVAHVFNVLIYVSLHTDLLRATFVAKAWGVARDLSNLFFILVLLYIAIKIILGLGGSEAKKMIARVILVAMLINFSMFFTEVIIDSSNILALIFYNKVSTDIKNPTTGKIIPYGKDGKGVTGETDVAGALVTNFNPTKTLSADFLKDLRTTWVNGVNEVNATEKIDTKVPVTLLIAIILFTGSLMYYVAIVLFVVAFAFLVRIIELWVLIIFSPFAFMSSTAPFLSGTPEIGWKAWFSRLIKTSFMAPIFMFFLYFIFMLINSDLFKGLIPQTTYSAGGDFAAVIKFLLGLLLPLLFVEYLLYKAMKFAVKSSGKVGEIAEKVVVGGAKMAGTLALAAATSGSSLAFTSTLGKASAGLAKSEGLREDSVKGGFFKRNFAKMTLGAANYGAQASGDFRKAPGAAALGKFTGLSLQGPKILGLGSREGGFKGDTERRAKTLKVESERYKTTKSDAEVKAESEAKQNEWKAKQQASGLTEEEYANKVPKPVFYKNANELNNARMQAFQGQLSEKGLFTTLIHKAIGKINENNFGKSDEYKKQYIKKYGKEKPIEYDKEVARNVNETRSRSIKMIIGGTKRMGEVAFSKDLEKGFAQMGKITEQIESNTKALENLHELLEGGVKDGFASGDKEKGFTINTDKIEDRLAELTAVARRAEIKQQKYIRLGDADNTERMNTAHNELFAATREINKLNKMKTAPKEERDLKRRVYELGKDKSSLEDKRAKELADATKPKEGEKDKGHGAAPKAPEHKEPAHEAPAAHPEPAPGGGGHDAHGGGGHSGH